MFSFHKPKVYRSPTGCCICKAKSSSSRFTDSKKYENDFIECFQLEERRNGEICNACVLLVKRWKKLPTGSNRNWRHVVDARAGPGIKSLTKFKSKNKKNPKDNLDKIEKILKKKHVYLKPDRYREQSPATSDDPIEEYLAGAGSKGSSRSGSPVGSDDTAIPDKRLNGQTPPIDATDVALHGWIDLTYFKREMVCCGTIFKGPYGEVIIDPSLMKPCLGCATWRQRRQGVGRESAVASPSPSSSPISATSPGHGVDSSVNDPAAKPLAGKTFSDSSSDSGYDESSNQGVGETKNVKPRETGSPKDEKVVAPNSGATTNGLSSTIVKTVQSKGIANTEAVRLKSDLPMKLVPAVNHEVDKFVCKPLATLSVSEHTGNVSIIGQTTTRPIVSAIPSNNSLVDFAIHASTRQSLAN